MKKGLIFWFTGLSGAGKSTVASAVKAKLEKAGQSVFVLDGDEVRKRYHQPLGFTPEDIRKNNALITEMCRENQEKYSVILVPIISPYRDSRRNARAVLAPDFYEVYIKASLDCVMERDVKGLYSKAKQNQMDNLIGFSAGSVYEPPEAADCVIDSERTSCEESVIQLYDFIMGQMRLRNPQKQSVK